MARGELPVLVGVGQAVSHWTAEEGVAAAPSYVSLAEQAISRALQDAGGGLPPDAIDTLAMVRTMEDSLPTSAYAFGRAANLPRAVAKAAGATPETAIYELTGGQSPQALVNEMGGRIYTGESDCALVVGSEVIGAMKAARRAGLDLDLSDDSDGPVEDRGLGASLLSRAEIKHGLVVPAYFYALFENAMAARRLETKEAHRAAMARLFKRYSDVAAANPYAQFPGDRSEAFLASPSKENYQFADPFLKWHMAQDAVNQAAAVLVMSESRADTFGIPADARVYLHGAGEASDDHISVRPVLDGSWAMAEALARAFEQANCSPADIALFDLYSCFPCAVFSACEALGIDPDSERRPLTVTGGLPFFGGPGNNYSLHAIASMVEAVRTTPGEKGLVLANGGWMAKEAAAIYSTERPTAFTPAA
ncbi:MAG: acetyl-CoA acetyltransferase, partial [Pseudomonadota bacterium]